MAQRKWIWLQVTIGWMPVGALFFVLIFTVHSNVSLLGALTAAVRLIASGALLGLGVLKLTRRFPWQYQFRVRFLAGHMVAACVYSVAWILFNSLIDSVLRGALVLSVGVGIVPFFVLGIWLYVMIAGVSYAIATSERAAQAEAMAAQSQLAALRAQLHPHFLFNTLHTVVQLIPRQPKTAALAAEQLAGLLRRSIEETRDLVTVEEELAFVNRYLDVERLRFGDRLCVESNVSVAAQQADMPSFALLTLVENAVRHGAEPNVNITTITIAAALQDGVLQVSVHDNGVGMDGLKLSNTQGTGLRRLRDRLTALYGQAARLEVTGTPDNGCNAVIILPAIPDE